MASKAEQIVRTFDVLNSEKGTINSHFQEITDLVMPSKSNVTNITQTPGSKRGQRRYDDTAVHANTLLGAAIHSSFTSSAIKWYEYHISELKEIQQVKEWMEECTEISYRYIQTGPFENQMNELYPDVSGYGTGCMHVGEVHDPITGEFKSLKFEAWPVRSYVFTEGADGRADAVYFEFELDAPTIVKRYGEKPFFRGLTPKMQDAFDSPDPNKRLQKFMLIRAIYPRSDRNRSKANSVNMPYASDIVAKDEKHTIYESGYMEFPNMIPRWHKNSDDNGWGRGPGMNALGTIKTLNTAEKLALKAWAKDLDPPLVVENKGVIGSVRTYAGGITYKRKGASMEYLYSGGRYDVTKYNKEDLKQNIKEYFHTDQLKMEVNDSKTLGEFQARYEMMMRLLGPTYGRLKHELFDPLHHRIFNILLRNNVFPDPPQEVYDLIQQGQQPTLDVEYLGPMAKAQRQQDIIAIESTIQYIGGIAKVTGDMSVIDNIDLDEASRMGADLKGVPVKLLRDPKMVAQMRQQRQKAQEAAQALETAERGAGIAKDMSGMEKAIA